MLICTYEALKKPLYSSQERNLSPVQVVSSYFHNKLLEQRELPEVKR